MQRGTWLCHSNSFPFMNRPCYIAFAATWGYGLSAWSASRLSGWNFVNPSASGYCHLAPMAAGSFASLIHAIYFCAALLSLAGMLAMVVATWMLFYSFVVSAFIKGHEH
jgi:hypothetical protein